MMLLADGHNDRREPSTGGISGHLDDWEELAVDYIDGQVDPSTARAIEAHLRECPECAERLRAQQSVMTFLEDIDYENPPAELQDRILGELLVPSQTLEPVRQTVRDEPSRWSLIWRRKIVPWIPATVGVVAVLAAVVTFGVLRTADEESLELTNSPTTTAASSVAVVLDGASQESARSSETTAAPDITTAALGVGAGASPPGESTETTTTAVAAATETGEVVQDKSAMIADLEAAGAPVYFVFDGAEYAGTEGGITEETSEGIAQQLTALTGLEPLDASLWLGGPTFAAYLPRENAKQLVELLLSIGASFRTSVGLTWQPMQAVTTDDGHPSVETDPVSRLLERKEAFPELRASRTPKPAVSDYSFTTSTTAPVDPGISDNENTGETELPGPTNATDRDGADKAPGEEDLAGGTIETKPPLLPDEAGTHVLIVIYVLD